MPSSTAGLLRSLLIYHGHPLRHRRLVRLYRPFVRPGDLVIDAGAHVGNHSRAFLALGAHVIAVEPQPAFARWLRRAFGRRRRFRLLEAALGPAEGEAELFVSSRTPTVSTLAAGLVGAAQSTPGFEKIAWDARTRVAVRTLDALAAEYGRPAFVKLDVEGFEAEALSGFSQAVPALCFEVLPAHRQAGMDCIARLANLGHYAFNASVAETARLAPDWFTAAEAECRIRHLDPAGREINLFARLED